MVVVRVLEVLSVRLDYADIGDADGRFTLAVGIEHRLDIRLRSRHLRVKRVRRGNVLHALRHRGGQHRQQQHCRQQQTDDFLHGNILLLRFVHLVICTISGSTPFVNRFGYLSTISGMYVRIIFRRELIFSFVHVIFHIANHEMKMVAII